MQIGAIDYNLAMTRSQEVFSQKLNEDNKALVDQAAYSVNGDKRAEDNALTIQKAGDIETQSQDSSASEQGKNEYAGDGGARRRQNQNGDKGQEIPVEGRVIKKTTSHFEFMA